MKATSPFLAGLILAAMMMLPVEVSAELSASVDRDRVAMGDTIRLTLAATNDEPINNVDLRPLLRDFEVLQRSSSSSTNIINGNMTSVRKVVLDITPKREGSLRIPALRVGREETNYLLIAVGPATTAAGDPLIDFQAELDKNSVYVQGQVILTLRIQQAVNLDSRSVSELELDNAFVKALEQQSFQRTIDGRPWLVHEIRYAIFPEQSGTLEIPAQTFSARERQPRRSVFDIAGGGRKLQRRTKPISIKVLPRPANYPDATWLPAQKLELTETWSTPPEQLKVGESATRRITITGEGLQGAQLPPMLFPSTRGLKYYPDQPVIEDTEVSGGLVGTRSDSAALVPTQAGEWTLEEIRIPWWDTKASKLRYATLPARTVTVATAINSSLTPALPNPTAVTNFDSGPIDITQKQPDSGIWPWLTAISTVLWLATLVFFLLRRRPQVAPLTQESESPSLKSTYRKLTSACNEGDTGAIRQDLIRWTDALVASRSIHSLDQVSAAFNDEVLDRLLVNLNASLFSTGENSFDGAQLLERVQVLAKAGDPLEVEASSELRLYPQNI